MDFATASAQFISQSVSVDRLINLLAVFSTVLGMFFTAIAVILGFLVWKQNELRKKAEEDVKKIGDIVQNIKDAKEEVVKMVGLASSNLTTVKQFAEQANNYLVGTEKSVKEIRGLVSKAQEDTKQFRKATNSIDTLLKSIEGKRNSLVTISGMASESPSRHSESKTLEELEKRRTEEAKMVSEYMLFEENKRRTDKPQ